MEEKEKIYRIVRKSQSGNNIQIIEDALPDTKASSNDWFTISEKVKSFVKNIEVGQQVKIGFVDKGEKRYLNFCTPVNGFKKKEKKNTPTFKAPTPGSDNNKVNESILKQVALKTTATVVASLGFTKEDKAEDILDISNKIFNGFYSKLTVNEAPSENLTETFSDEPKEEINTSDEGDGEVIILD